MIWYSNLYMIPIELTPDQIATCTHQGDCTENVQATVAEIADQLSMVNPEDIADELQEFGAWSEDELSNHQDNLERLVWTAACDLSEES